MNPLWQYAVVYALLLWCLWRLVRKYAPNASWRWQAKISYFLESRNAEPFNRIGRSLRPAVSIPAGCASHCRSCNSCA
jgi:hypothetical protein